MKEQTAPSAAPFGSLTTTPFENNPAERVAAAYRASVERTPRMIGTTEMKLGDEKISLFVRRLSPQEDKLVLGKLAKQDLPDLASYLGTLLGAAHARSCKAEHAPRGSKRGTKWSPLEIDTVREHAISIAGIHEAVYLALCDRARTILPEGA
jgi:hypothetical protein